MRAFEQDGTKESRYETGPYNIVNKSKYAGTELPKYKSSFEARMMWWLDTNKNVTKWAYEPFFIEYYMTLPKGFEPHLAEILDGKKHKYYIDFYVELIDVNGIKTCYIIEIKPKKMLFRPAVPKKKTKKTANRYVQDMKEYIRKNQMKKFQQ